MATKIQQTRADLVKTIADIAVVLKATQVATAATFRTGTKRQRRWKRALTVLGVLMVSLIGCGPAPQPGMTENQTVLPTLSPVKLAPGEKLRVVVTTSLIEDVVHQVGDDQIELTCLVPRGADPHTFQPSPGTARAVAEAHVILKNGLGLEEGWLNELITHVGNNQPVVSLSTGIKSRTEQRLEGTESHGHGDQDPHVWFDVRNVMTWVKNTERILRTLDPSGREYSENASRYLTELEALDAWIVDQVNSIPPANRKLVTSHYAFGYFADRYGLELIGSVFPITTEAEPSARDLAQLEEAIRQHQVRAIFAENTINPRLVEQIAHDTGVKVVLLYTGALGPPGSGVETYVDLMRYDVKAIVAALK